VFFLSKTEDLFQALSPISQYLVDQNNLIQLQQQQKMDIVEQAH
jgi:hypothetical protein